MTSIVGGQQPVYSPRPLHPIVANQDAFHQGLVAAMIRLNERQEGWLGRSKAAVPLPHQQSGVFGCSPPDERKATICFAALQTGRAAIHQIVN